MTQINELRIPFPLIVNLNFEVFTPETYTQRSSFAGKQLLIYMAGEISGTTLQETQLLCFQSRLVSDRKYSSSLLGHTYPFMRFKRHRFQFGITGAHTVHYKQEFTKGPRKRNPWLVCVDLLIRKAAFGEYELTSQVYRNTEIALSSKFIFYGRIEKSN